MRKSGLTRVILVAGLAAFPSIGYAAEHGGKEHGGQTQEHGGKTQEPGGQTQEHGGATQEHGGQAASAEPSAEQIRQTIRDYVAQIEGEKGAFTIEDEQGGGVRTLTLDRVHDRVGKTGDKYYSCTDMLDAESGEKFDLDFDVDAAEGGGLEVVDVRIHKVNDQPRYTYDEQDNRIPLL